MGLWCVLVSVALSFVIVIKVRSKSSLVLKAICFPFSDLHHFFFEDVHCVAEVCAFIMDALCDGQGIINQLHK